MRVLQARAAHSDRLERWLGKDEIERISAAMADWYGPPIPVANVPGKICAHKGGDFRGPMDGGQIVSFQEFLREKRRKAFKRWARQQRRTFHAGFASISELVSEMAAGKRADFTFQKVGTTGVVAATNSLWAVGNQPAAGGNGSAAPGGRAPTDVTAGAFPFANPTGGDTQHMISANPLSTVGGNTLLLYDRIFDVAKTMNSNTTEAVTGVPSRYQGTTRGNADYAGGNFLFVECTTVLPATAHNWTTCTYTDQDGNTGATLPSLTGNSGNIVNRLDHPTGQWFAPLASGDDGIKALTQMQCSAAVATGAINFVVGHPLAWMPCGIANLVTPSNYVTDLVNLIRVFDDACMAFLEVLKGATTATTYTGQFTTAWS